jgi:hypothetical protein
LSSPLSLLPSAFSPQLFFTSSSSLLFLFPFPPLFSLLPHCFLSCFSLSPHFPNSIPLSTRSNSPTVLFPPCLYHTAKTLYRKFET